MARFRLAGPAQNDLANILSISAERGGADGRLCYAAVIAAALRQVAAHPEGPVSRKRPGLGPGIFSFHVRHARVPREAQVRHPVHLLYYRFDRDGVIEVLRVLHERMDPNRHLDIP